MESEIPPYKDEDDLSNSIIPFNSTKHMLFAIGLEAEDTEMSKIFIVLVFAKETLGFCALFYTNQCNFKKVPYLLRDRERYAVE